MQLQLPTSSFCNNCYRVIPAVVRVGGTVVIEKHCPEHGKQLALLERDPVFYTYIKGLKSNTIYNGYFVDVTRVCNLRCTYCYYHLETKDPEGEYTIDSIVNECAAHAHLVPFVLTGGECTTRNDLPELIAAVSEVGPVEIITNGVRLAKAELFDAIIPLLTRKGMAMVHLSIHKDETDKWRDVIALARARKVKLASILIVVDSKESFKDALAFVDEFKDVACGFRIKAASKIWSEQKPEDKIFVSDMLRWMEEAGCEYQILTNLANKTVFLNVLVNGVWLMLVSWNDTANVDLNDIDCAPYYKARNGEVANMVVALLINEGWDKGMCKGRKL